MKQRFPLYTLSALALLAVLFTLNSCKEDAIIKSSLTPAVDNIHTFGIGRDFHNGTDTITIKTKTGYEDSLVTSGRNTGFPIFHALGWVKDPFAGTTTGGIYFEPLPTYVGLTLPTNCIGIDSVVLVLPYAGFRWGDTTIQSSVKVNVFTSLDTVALDSNYYNYSGIATTGAVLGSATIRTGPLGTGGIEDSVMIGGINRAPHLRIRLDTTKFNGSLVNSIIVSDSFFTSFRNQFRGFFIVPDTSGSPAAALPYFRLNGTSDIYGAAAVLIYANVGSSTDTVIQLPYQESAAGHFNRITRNYSTAAKALFTATDTNASVVMMQNSPGAIVDLFLPYIQKLPKNVIINKAELILTAVDDPTGSAAKYFGPARLFPGGMNATGGRYTIADRYPITDNTLNFIDGTPQQIMVGSKTITQYHINLPEEIQKTIVQGVNGIHLRIGGTANFPAAYRVLLGGSGNPDSLYRPYINIIYSKQ